MENGVEAFVDMIKESDSKQLIVITRGDEDCKIECVTVLKKIIQVINETKIEICHRISPSLYLLNPNDILGDQYPSPVSSLPCYPLQHVLRKSERGEKYVLSVDKKSRLPLKEIPLEMCTHWNVFFPMDMSMVVSAVKEVSDWKLLGMNLGIEWRHLEEIEKQKGSEKERMLQMWMSDKPTWPRLVEALREPSFNLRNVAATITQEHNVSLQQELLDERRSMIRPTPEFLESFASIIGPRWPCFVSPLSLTPEDIVTTKREIQDTEPTRQALAMLNKWAAMETATYGQLRESLCNHSVFHI